MCTWQPKRRVKGAGRSDAPTHPDQLWQRDIRYTNVAGRNYYLRSFLCPVSVGIGERRRLS